MPDGSILGTCAVENTSYLTKHNLPQLAAQALAFDSLPSMQINVLQVSSVLTQEKPVGSATPPPPHGTVDTMIEIFTHRDLSKEKGFKPRLTLQVQPLCPCT